MNIPPVKSIAMEAVKPVEQRNQLPEIKESLRVEKRTVESGGYRLTKLVKTRDAKVDEMLLDQRIDIERRAIGQQLAAGEAPPESRYEGDTLVIPVVEEILVTEKRLVLVEEVRVTRIQGTRRFEETVALREEVIAIEPLAAGPPADKPV